MVARGVAAVLWGLCACGEAAPVRAAKVEDAPDPWAVMEEEGIPPRLRFTEGPALELTERIGGVSKEWSRPVVVITREAIGFAGESVLELADGRIPAGEVKGPVVPRLVEVLGRMSAKSGWVMLLADRRLRFDDLVLVMNSAVRAGFGAWSFAVRRPEDPIGTATGQLLSFGSPWDRPAGSVRTMRDELYLDDRVFVLAMMIRADGLEIGQIRHTGAVERLARFTHEEGLTPVRMLARELAGRLEPTDHMPHVVYGVEPEVPIERVIGALASVGGTADCDRPLFERDRGVCWFPVPILDSHARSLWDLAVVALGAVTLTLEQSEPARSRHRRVRSRYRISGEQCSVEVGPGQVTAVLRSRHDEVRLIMEDDGRRRVAVDVAGLRVEVADPSLCARFSAEVTRSESVARAGVLLRGFLDLDCDLGVVTWFDERYRARVAGRVNFAPCG